MTGELRTDPRAGGMHDVVALVINEHDALRSLVTEARRWPATPGVVADVINALAARWARYANCAEAVVLPEASADESPDGCSTAHARIDTLMADVVRAPAPERLDAVAEALTRHLDHERVNLLDPLCERVDVARRSVLAARYTQATETASERRPGW